MKGRPALQMTVFLAALFIVLGNGRISGGDGEAMYQVTRAMAGRGRLDLPPGILPPVETILADSTDTQIPYTVLARDGRSYAKYGLGQSLAALPLYGLGVAWGAITGQEGASRSATAFLNALLVACTAGLLLKLAGELGYPRRAGVVLALVCVLCTPLWAYTHTFFSEPLVTFCLVGATLALRHYVDRDRASWLALATGLLGMAHLTRIDSLAALPAFVLYLGLQWRAKHLPIGTLARHGAAAAGAWSAGVGLMLLYNTLRFGSPVQFGYETSNWQTPVLTGLYGLTVSPGKGLLWYAPPILVGLAGLPAFARRHRYEAVLCGTVVVGYLALHSAYTYWEGGWCWGPRLILPALPFALLPALPLLSGQRGKQSLELFAALVLALGLLVQIPAVGSDYARPLQEVYATWPAEFQERVLYHPAHSPILGQWRSLLQVTANLRSPDTRAQLATLLAETQPKAETLLLANSYEEALRLEKQTILAFNLPDLWLLTQPWLQEDNRP